MANSCSCSDLRGTDLEGARRVDFSYRFTLSRRCTALPSELPRTLSRDYLGGEEVVAQQIFAQGEE
jgi:hypothetical protein